MKFAEIRNEGALNSLELEENEDGDVRLVIFEAEGDVRSVINVGIAADIQTLCWHLGDYLDTLDLKFDTDALTWAECLEAMYVEKEDK